MSISAASAVSGSYSYPAPAPSASSQTAQTAFTVDGTPPDGTQQPVDPTQQPGGVHHRHHHHGGAGAGLASASGATPQSTAANSVASALNVLA